MEFRPIKNFSNETFRDYTGDLLVFLLSVKKDEGVTEQEVMDRMPVIIRKIYCLGSILEIAANDGWDHKLSRQKNWDYYFEDAYKLIDDLKLINLKENFIRARENDENEDELMKLTEELQEIMPEISEVLDAYLIDNHDQLYREWEPNSEN